jgi:hypothetical protein
MEPGAGAAASKGPCPQRAGEKKTLPASGRHDEGDEFATNAKGWVMWPEEDDGLSDVREPEDGRELLFDDFEDLLDLDGAEAVLEGFAALSTWLAVMVLFYPDMFTDEKIHVLVVTLKRLNFNELGPQLFAAYNRYYYGTKAAGAAALRSQSMARGLPLCVGQLRVECRAAEVRRRVSCVS